MIEEDIINKDTNNFKDIYLDNIINDRGELS
jgi:hypothetical protein